MSTNKRFPQLERFPKEVLSRHVLWLCPPIGHDKAATERARKLLGLEQKVNTLLDQTIRQLEELSIRRDHAKFSTGFGIRYQSDGHNLHPASRTFSDLADGLRDLVNRQKTRAIVCFTDLNLSGGNGNLRSMLTHSCYLVALQDGKSDLPTRVAKGKMAVQRGGQDFDFILTCHLDNPTVTHFFHDLILDFYSFHATGLRSLYDFGQVPEDRDLYLENKRNFIANSTDALLMYGQQSEISNVPSSLAFSCRSSIQASKFDVDRYSELWKQHCKWHLEQRPPALLSELERRHAVEAQIKHVKYEGGQISIQKVTDQINALILAESIPSQGTCILAIAGRKPNTQKSIAAVAALFGSKSWRRGRVLVLSSEEGPNFLTYFPSVYLILITY